MKKIDAMVLGDDEDGDGAENDSSKDDREIFEVEKVIGICYGNPPEWETRVSLQRFYGRDMERSKIHVSLWRG